MTGWRRLGRLLGMQLPDVNLYAISDLATREVVQQLLNIIEALAAENAALRAEDQQLHLAPGRFFRRLRPRVQPTANNQAHARRLRAEPELLVEAHGVVREEVDVLPRQLFQQETHYRTPDPAMAVG